MNLFKYFGPSTLVTAAFIGPGTVTLCSITGAASGYNLIWVLLFSVITTIIFQEMAARLGVVTQEGLGEAIRKSKLPNFSRLLMIAISFGAIIIGNAAYEAGNLAGAVLGLDLLIEGFKFWPLVLGVLAFAILSIGRYAILEKVLTSLVILMSICFLVTAIMLRPSFSEILGGFIPNRIDFDKILIIIGLIGTTVVPYNLFLHASSISEKYKSVENLRQLRIENIVAIALGGIISISIVISSAKIYAGGTEFTSISDFAKQLEPLLGSYAKTVMALGFFAAGLSSAITAPLAAAYAAQGLFGKTQIDDKSQMLDELIKAKNKRTFKDPIFRLTWLTILVIGVFVAMSGFKPIAVIKFAQVANGILLPLIAGFLIYILNAKEIMGTFVNSKFQNIIAAFVLFITIALASKSLINVFG